MICPRCQGDLDTCGHLMRAWTIPEIAAAHERLKAMPIFTDKKCPECPDLDLDERLDRLIINIPEADGQGGYTQHSARVFSCQRGHTWLLVKL